MFKNNKGSEALKKYFSSLKDSHQAGGYFRQHLPPTAGPI